MAVDHAVECPVPDFPERDRVTLAHGGGGRRMRDLITGIFAPAFWPGGRLHQQDGAALRVPGDRLVFTTDAYVVRPLFFPGGDIGTLAVNGTLNDLAVCGAVPLALAVTFVLEEGLPLEVLRRITASMARAAARDGVRIVTGDTKVVEKGRGDGLYVTTAGIGFRPEGREPGPEKVVPGDAILVSGDLGRHGVAVMVVREGLEMETGLMSDCASLVPLVEGLYRAGLPVHCMRDLTRGGLAAALNEIAEAAGVRMELEETAIPVAEEVKAACEILGLDPLYVANEGRLVLILPEEAVESALTVMRSQELGRGARRIGRVTGPEAGGRVVVRTPLGTRRVLDLLSGEQLPRIC